MPHIFCTTARSMTVSGFAMNRAYSPRCLFPSIPGAPAGLRPAFAPGWYETRLRRLNNSRIGILKALKARIISARGEGRAKPGWSPGNKMQKGKRAVSPIHRCFVTASGDMSTQKMPYFQKICSIRRLAGKRRTFSRTLAAKSSTVAAAAENTVANGCLLFNLAGETPVLPMH